MAYQLKNPASPQIPKPDYQLETRKLEAKLRELEKRYEENNRKKVATINKLVKENEKLKQQLKEKKK